MLSKGLVQSRTRLRLAAQRWPSAILDRTRPSKNHSIMRLRREGSVAATDPCRTLGRSALRLSLAELCGIAPHHQILLEPAVEHVQRGGGCRLRFSVPRLNAGIDEVHSGIVCNRNIIAPISISENRNASLSDCAALRKPPGSESTSRFDAERRSLVVLARASTIGVSSERGLQRFLSGAIRRHEHRAQGENDRTGASDVTEHSHFPSRSTKRA